MIIFQSENLKGYYDCRSNVHENWSVAPHIHEYSELVITKSGVASVTVDGTVYRLPPKHLLLIFPNQIHGYSNETCALLRCAVFSNDHVPAFFDLLKQRRLAHPVLDLSDAPLLLEALDRLPEEDVLSRCGLLNLVCGRLLRATHPVEDTDRGRSVLYAVIRELSENFREDIRLKDLAKKFGYNEKYLSSVLHSLTGMNFRTLLATYRINHAKALLRSGRSPALRISEVALLCGFSSINSFNRAFRQLTGTTPTLYRLGQ